VVSVMGQEVELGCSRHHIFFLFRTFPPWSVTEFAFALSVSDMSASFLFSQGADFCIFLAPEGRRCLRIRAICFLHIFLFAAHTAFRSPSFHLLTLVNLRFNGPNFAVPLTPPPNARFSSFSHKIVFQKLLSFFLFSPPFF